MTISPWQRRIQRAEQLVEQYRYAAELLGFYIHLARFQEDLHRFLREALPLQAIHTCPPLRTVDLSQLGSKFESFLRMAEEYGPTSLGAISRDLRMRGPAFWSELMTRTWQKHALTAPELVTAAFLQPCAELLRSRALNPVGRPNLALCPFCGRKPGLGILRPMGEGATRWLGCTFCLTEWSFRRILCPSCGEEAESKLSVFVDDTTIRVECCDTCKTYLKTIDMTKDGHAEPLVDELASAPLDLWAHEHGYAKIRLNLLGL